MGILACLFTGCAKLLGLYPSHLGGDRGGGQEEFVPHARVGDLLR